MDSSDNPFISVFSNQGLSLKNGCFSLSDAPGLGYEPDIDMAAEYLIHKEEICL